MSEATPARTLVLVKPDGVARGLVGEVISRLEGIKCGNKNSSCPDQLACALKQG